MPGVGAQVHHDLLDLRRIRAHVHRRSRQAHDEFDLRGQGGAQQLQRLLDHRLQRLRVELLRLHAAEGQDLLHQAARAHRGALDLREAGVAGQADRRVLARGRHIADDGGEDVVEIVRDSAGQGADGFHLLRIAQLRLERDPAVVGEATLVDVGQHAQRVRSAWPASSRMGRRDNDTHIVLPSRRRSRSSIGCLPLPSASEDAGSATRRAAARGLLRDP